MRSLPPLALALAIASSLVAQDVATVEPGGVATIVVVARAPGPGDTVTYTFHTAPGIRLFAPATGTETGEEGTVLIPFTLGVPADAHAGTVHAGSVDLTWGSGPRETRAVAVEVRPRRGAELMLGSESVAATPGGMVRIDFELHNGGNAPDTFRLDVGSPAAWSAVFNPALVVAAGAGATGSVRLVVSPTARRGEEHVVRLTVTGQGVRIARSARVVVVGDETRIGSLAMVPGSIFLGSSTGPGGTVPSVGLAAAGEIRPGTRATVAVRHVDGVAPAPAFRRDLAGPRLLLALDGPASSVRAGDVFAAPDLILGPMIQGRGLDGAIARGALTAHGFIARPWSDVGLPDRGHMARAALVFNTAAGQFGLAAGTSNRTGQLGIHSQSGATATYRVRSGGHDLQADLGVLRVGDDSVAVTGPAARLDYTLDLRRLGLSAMLRTVPATTARTTSYGDEARVAASVDVGRGITATGWAFASEAPPVGTGRRSASKGAAGGLRVRLPGRISARILGSYRETRIRAGTADGSGSAGNRSIRSVRSGLDIPVGPFTVEGQIESGTLSGPVQRPHRNGRLGVRWVSGNQWAWVGVSRQDYGGGPLTSLDLNGAVRISTAELQGGFQARTGQTDPLHILSAWSAVTVPVTQTTALVAGVEQWNATGGGSARISLGVSRSLGVPLPFPRIPVIQGIVFEDLNGNGIRDPGEPALPRVPISMGLLRTETGPDGVFRFYDTAQGDLFVDGAGLPEGMLSATPPLPSSAASGRAIQIPVIRTGSLELTIFFDRDGDGRFQDQDQPAAGAVAVLTGSQGNMWETVADRHGTVRFRALPPGEYVLHVYRPGADPGRLRPHVRELVVAPGSATREMIPLPHRHLEIRVRVEADPVALTPDDR
jgi:hypothetical protein